MRILATVDPQLFQWQIVCCLCVLYAWAWQGKRSTQVPVSASVPCWLPLDAVSASCLGHAGFSFIDTQKHGVLLSLLYFQVINSPLTTDQQCLAKYSGFLIHPPLFHLLAVTAAAKVTLQHHQRF